MRVFHCDACGFVSYDIGEMFTITIADKMYDVCGKCEKRLHAIVTECAWRDNPPREIGPVCGCGHAQSYHNKTGCTAPIYAGAQHQCRCTGFKPLDCDIYTEGGVVAQAAGSALAAQRETALTEIERNARFYSPQRPVELPAAFADLVEGGRTLTVSVEQGMVTFALEVLGGVRLTFRLDSETAPDFREAVRVAANRVRAIKAISTLPPIPPAPPVLGGEESPPAPPTADPDVWF